MAWVGALAASGAFCATLAALVLARHPGRPRALAWALTIGLGVGALVALAALLPGASTPGNTGWIALATSFVLVAAILQRGRPWHQWVAIGAWAAAAAFAATFVATALGEGPGRAGSLLAIVAASSAVAALPWVAREVPRKWRILLPSGAGGVSALVIGVTGSLVVAGGVACASLGVAVVRSVSPTGLSSLASRVLVATATCMTFWTLLPQTSIPAVVPWGIGIAAGFAAALLLELLSPGLVRTTPRGRPSTAGFGPYEVGDVILGRLRVVELLGAGGAAQTYHVRDTVDGGDWAAKVPVSAGAAVLLADEADAMRRVRHAGVVACRGILGDGADTILLLQYAPGGSLADRMQDGGMGPEFASVGGDLLDALAAVHAAGLLHQDLKPSNILFAADGKPMLADFGTAKDAPMSPDVTMGPTLGAGPEAGTVRFMAPEVAAGGRATVASDIFSAAATLYEAYTGTPYLAPAPRESVLELRLRAARHRPFDAALPDPVLAGWFAKALDPDPSGRYGTAAEARDAFFASWKAAP